MRNAVPRETEVTMTKLTVDAPWYHEDWMTIIVRPSLWWRLKYLFKPHDLIFCTNPRKYFCVGFNDQFVTSIGGIPTKLRDRQGMEI